MSKGKLFLIPSYLSPDNDLPLLSPIVVEVLKQVDHFLVENVRTARRFISSLKAGIEIEQLRFEILDKHTSFEKVFELFNTLKTDSDIGIISEAGLPCLADPGHLAVTCAHQIGMQVVPLPGASSIQMALIASGFNGQQFTFHGYLPIEKKARIKRIKELEGLARTGYTQLFMETPYRNEPLLKDILINCKPDTYLSIAANITAKQEFIQTQSIKKWKTQNINIHKVPTIFSFGQYS